MEKLRAIGVSAQGSTLAAMSDVNSGQRRKLSAVSKETKFHPRSIKSAVDPLPCLNIDEIPENNAGKSNTAEFVLKIFDPRNNQSGKNICTSECSFKSACCVYQAATT